MGDRDKKGAGPPEPASDLVDVSAQLAALAGEPGLWRESLLKRVTRADGLTPWHELKLKDS
ncbi:hypothetical protein M728_004082 (plasmid) [Ensifer sp. WSM1721]